MAPTDAVSVLTRMLVSTREFWPNQGLHVEFAILSRFIIRAKGEFTQNRCNRTSFAMDGVSITLSCKLVSIDTTTVSNSQQFVG